MIIDDIHYDVIVIGSGAAGGTIAGQLAASGKRILLLERGGVMPLADQNVADVDLFRKDRYHPGEQWFGTDGDPFSPQTIYALGGNTKIWGGVLERLLEEPGRDLAPERTAGHRPSLRAADPGTADHRLHQGSRPDAAADGLIELVPCSRHRTARRRLPAPGCGVCRARPALRPA